ncbi:hypothetical protein [Deinococcus sp.]|uniref:hypothetical protein n=1 Tax=Deinococcus sp. TaxID=47478 RepID=UPI0025C3EF28|nr:hypothetical protein [Deinococcus sp.]
MTFDDKITFGVDNGEIPGLLGFLTEEAVAFVGLHARDLEVTSMLVMELLQMDTSLTHDSSNSGSVTACKFRCG